MSVFFKRFADRQLLTACLLACLGCPGCAGWKAIDGGQMPALNEPWPRQAGAAPETAGPEESAPAADPLADRAVFARRGDDQGRSVWIRVIRPIRDECPPPDGYAPSSWRWRYPDLEELLARPPRRRPNLHRYLADKDPIVAANAAIALARAGDDSGRNRLADAVRSPTTSDPMRCAAVEALAALRGPPIVRLLWELIDQYGRREPPDGSNYDRSNYKANLHAELIRGLARHLDPADDPRFVEALRSRAPEVRLTALEAWSAGRRGTLPTEAVHLSDDPDSRVRAAALLAMARRRHPEAHTHLSAALLDHDVQVRFAAIAALGELGGPEAGTTLETQLESPTDRIRGAAVSALARLGAKQLVLEAAGDESWRVRMQVARALAAYPDRDGAAAARKLLGDPSAEVQRQVPLALAEWPLAQAGPILLTAMGKLAFTTRKAAAEQLAERWPPAAEFPLKGPQQRRESVLDDLQGRFRRQVGLVDRAALSEAAAGGQPAAAVAPRQLARIEQLVQHQDVQALVDFGPGLVEALEQLVFDRQQVLPEVIYRDVLPQYEPVFAVLNRLSLSDPSERRRAAAELVELAAQRPLRLLALARLNRLVAAEPDQLVWQSVLTSLAGDAREPAIRLAYTAIGHSMPEVRRRACENLAAVAHPRHAAVLLPALDDSSHSVRCAAVYALGVAGRIDEAGPLRRLLGTTNEELRLEAGVALLRLGDPAGRDALQRLAHSFDAKIRRRVARRMGEMPDPSFVPTLIGMLDDQVAVGRTALESLPKVVGQDVSASDDGSPATTSQRMRRWQQWAQRQAVLR